MREIMERAGDLLTMVHVADGFDHRASSGLRYITNPPGNAVRVHQHLDIGQGEVDWSQFFGTLHEIQFDGIVTACVFAWEDRAVESSRFMRQEIQRQIERHWKG
jgi:myo-inositol catabolism protein IolH